MLLSLVISRESIQGKAVRRIIIKRIRPTLILKQLSDISALWLLIIFQVPAAKFIVEACSVDQGGILLAD